MKFEVPGRGLHVEERNFLSRFDLNFAFVIFAINLIGIINLYSATHGIFHKDKTELFWMQLAWLTMGWLVFLSVTLLDYKIFIRMSYILYAMNIVALIAVDVIGKVSLGA